MLALGAITAAIVVVIALSANGHAVLAVRALAGLCAVGALYRAMFASSRWFAAKNRAFDALLLSGFAVMLFWLSPYAALSI
ncbi:MAG: hypothetical protein Q4A71_02515 [Actinomycetaceae bacterium]|nr:hypothetical protein [Actinomycetaceae bacterium]